VQDDAGRRKIDFLRRSFFAGLPGDRMRRFINAYYHLLSVLLGASVGILIVPVTVQMISRFTALIPAWIWTEEMARFLFIWMVMLGAMIGVRDASHFECDVWPELKPRANALLRIVSTVFVLLFALVFVWYGIKFVQFGWSQTSELADMPMTWIFIAWPLTGATWLLFGVERILADIRIVLYGPGAADEPPHRDPAQGGVV
jgi:TRAP-type C4-dicarboxylate transport system permease small subunit